MDGVVVKYKSIDYENRDTFDHTCNELAKENWLPVFPVVVYITSKGVIHYYQQWTRDEFEKK